MSKTSKLYSFCDSAINKIFGILTFIILFVNILNIVDGDLIVGCIELILLAILIVVILYCYFRTDLFLKVSKIIKKLSVAKMLTIIVVLSLLTKCFFLFLFRVDSSEHPDIAMYWSFIKQLANEGKIVENAEYAVRYSYTVMYSVFYLSFAKITHSTNIIHYELYLIILFTITAIFLFDLIKYHKGKNLAFVTTLIWILSPIGMTAPLALIHENGFLVFHIIVLWLLFRLRLSVQSIIIKICSVAAAGLILAYATSFNRFGIISIIAITILLVMSLIKRKWNWKAFVVVLLIPAYFCTMLLFVSTIKDKCINKVVDSSEVVYDTSYSLPNGWGLYLGANYEHSGRWNEEDFNTYEQFRNFDNPEDALNYQKKLVKNRYKEYLNSPQRILFLIIEKLKEMWGSQFISIYYDGFGQSEFSNWFFNSHNGLISKLTKKAFLMMAFIPVFFMSLGYRRNLIEKNESQTALLNYLRLFLIGATLVLLPFEVTFKYTSMFWVIYYAVFAFQFEEINTNLKAIDKRIKAWKRN